MKELELKIIVYLWWQFTIWNKIYLETDLNNYLKELWIVSTDEEYNTYVEIIQKEIIYKVKNMSWVEFDLFFWEIMNYMSKDFDTDNYCFVFITFLRYFIEINDLREKTTCKEFQRRLQNFLEFIKKKMSQSSYKDFAIQIVEWYII